VLVCRAVVLQVLCVRVWQVCWVELLAVVGAGIRQCQHRVLRVVLVWCC
jgi:hypothetical protein